MNSNQFTACVMLMLTHQNEIIVEFNRALKISSFYCILSAYLQVRILISFGKY